MRAFEAAKVNIDLGNPVSGFALTAAFPGVTFKQPVAIVTPPGETNRLFVVERGGLILVITNLAAPNRTVFLDLQESTASGYIETGLLGLAFHPNFQSNGQFFTYRTLFSGSLKDRISRFTISGENPNRAKTNEVILIDQEDVADTHNAGDIHFGPDGYLYISVGDESPSLADRRTTKQAIDGGLFGGILRIDVDQRPGNLPPNAHPSVVGNYSIPADNPFIGATSFDGATVDPSRVRTEFYAVGMRNPWRFSFDPASGDLFVGDVGHGLAEEVNRVVKGGNYGWPYIEAVYPHEETLPQGIIGPHYYYGRGRGLMQGFCVIGGVFCRNVPIAGLEGWYIFGDIVSGNIWKMRPDNPDDIEWVARETEISAFGRDPATGDVLVANLSRGELRRLVYVAPGENHVPTQLSETGVFSDLADLTPAAGIVPFEINVPFWSDNAIKSRWFGLMNESSQMQFAVTNNWAFPHGSVWVKHFELQMNAADASSKRRIETRLIVKSGEDFHGFTYKWNEDGRNAELAPASGLSEELHIVEAGGLVRTQIWNYPARGDCVTCHSRVGGGALGFNTAQLNLVNGVPGAPENQLERFRQFGYFQANTIETTNFPALAKSSDTNQPLEFRVKSFLSANCSQCHQPGGVWDAKWDARWTTAMSAQGIMDIFANNPAHIGAKIVDPGVLTNSMLYRRLTDPEWRMPPIASTVLDEKAGSLVGEWITNLPDGNFQEFAIGESVLKGSVTQSGATRAVSGIGVGMTGSNADRLHLVAGTIKRGGHIVAHLARVATSQPAMRAGIMVRDSSDPGAAAVWLARDTGGNGVVIARDDSGFPAIESSLGKTLQPWIRLVRNGDHISAWDSADRLTWQKITQVDFLAGPDALAGVAVASGEDWRYATAEFDALETLSVELQIGDATGGAPLPHDLDLQATVTANAVAPARVDFYADGTLIGSATAAPWRMAWTNAWAGSYPVRATVVDENGIPVDSESQTVTFTASPPIAHFIDSLAVGPDWAEKYALLGRALPAVTTDLAERTLLTVVRGAPVEFGADGILPDGDSAIPSTAWVDPTQLRFDYRPASEVAHRFTLFFAPFENNFAEKITIRDLGSGAILDVRTMSEYQGGRFMEWAVRGPISITIENSSGAAHLSGILLGTLPPPVVRLQPVASPVELPASILLQAEASAEGREITRVEFWDGNLKIGEDRVAPFEFAWTNALAGEHSLTAWAIGEYGLGVRSEPISVNCTLPPASVVYFGEDRKTQGDWIGIYGELGAVVPTGWTNLAPTITTKVNAQEFLIAFPVKDAGSLLVEAGHEERLASCYVVNRTDELEIRAAAADGRQARLGLYFLDWFGPGRLEQVQIVDSASGEVLDERVVGSFIDGDYLVWNFVGEIRVLIRSLNDYNTIVNGIFFDAPERLSSFWFRQNFPKIVESPARWVEDPDADGRPNFIEYAAGSHPDDTDLPLMSDLKLANGSISFALRLGLTPVDVRLNIDRSTDLANWEQMPVQVSGNAEHHVPFSFPVPQEGPQFFRLRATLLQN